MSLRPAERACPAQAGEAISAPRMADCFASPPMTYRAVLSDDFAFAPRQQLPSRRPPRATRPPDRPTNASHPIARRHRTPPSSVHPSSPAGAFTFSGPPLAALCPPAYPHPQAHPAQGRPIIPALSLTSSNNRNTFTAPRHDPASARLRRACLLAKPTDPTANGGTARQAAPCRPNHGFQWPPVKPPVTPGSAAAVIEHPRACTRAVPAPPLRRPTAPARRAIGPRTPAEATRQIYPAPDATAYAGQSLTCSPADRTSHIHSGHLR